MEELMKANYIRMYKIDNLNGGFFFSVTTERHCGAETTPIGIKGYELLGRAYVEGRRIEVWHDKDGKDSIYTIHKD